MRRIPSVRRKLVLAEARMLSPTVRELVLRSEDGGALDYLAGQFWKLYLPGGLDRDYSVASAPEAARADRFAIAVTRVDGGPGSEELHRMEVGAAIEGLGPNGLFVREAAHLALPAIYVGTGTGLAPLRAMLEEELARPDGPEQTLLFGCRTEDEILWRTDLERWAAASPRFRYEVTLSRGPDAWRGRRGWVQLHLAELVAPRLPAHVYVCGLSKMVGDVRRVLKEEIGVDRRLVHSERYD
jgi:ferredoxin-NADP reductase